LDNSHISKARLLDKGRALYRRQCKRDATFPALLPVAGKVEVTDAVRVTLPTVAGQVDIIAVPIGGWRFRLEYCDLAAPTAPAAAASVDVKAAVAPVSVQSEAQFAAKSVVQVRHHIDAVLDLLGDLDSRADSLAEQVTELAMRAHAAGAKFSNVVHVNNIAAE
jgi:hypothetical protein